MQTTPREKKWSVFKCLTSWDFSGALYRSWAQTQGSSTMEQHGQTFAREFWVSEEIGLNIQLTDEARGKVTNILAQNCLLPPPVSLSEPNVAYYGACFLLLLSRWLLASGCYSLTDSGSADHGSGGAIETEFYSRLCRDISLPGQATAIFFNLPSNPFYLLCWSIDTLAIFMGSAVP